MSIEEGAPGSPKDAFRSVLYDYHRNYGILGRTYEDILGNLLLEHPRQYAVDCINSLTCNIADAGIDYLLTTFEPGDPIHEAVKIFVHSAYDPIVAVDHNDAVVKFGGKRDEDAKSNAERNSAYDDFPASFEVFEISDTRDLKVAGDEPGQIKSTKVNVQEARVAIYHSAITKAINSPREIIHEIIDGAITSQAIIDGDSKALTKQRVRAYQAYFLRKLKASAIDQVSLIASFTNKELELMEDPLLIEYEDLVSIRANTVERINSDFLPVPISEQRRNARWN